MIVPLAVFFDIVVAGVPGAFSLYAILLAYTTSFFSRRFLVEYRGIGTVLYALFVGIGAIGYICFYNLFFQAEIFSRGIGILSDVILAFSVSKILFSMIFGPLLFIGIYQIIDRFEKYMSSIAQRNFVNIK